jgi:hypothetical protein
MINESGSFGGRSIGKGEAEVLRENLPGMLLHPPQIPRDLT